jgi:hypothetical protein
VTTPDSTASILIPPAFEPDPARAATYEHGGSVWSDGPRSIAIFGPVGADLPPSFCGLTAIGPRVDGFGASASVGADSGAGLSMVAAAWGPQAADTASVKNSRGNLTS